MSTLPITVSVAFVHGMLGGLCTTAAPATPWLAQAGIAPAVLEETGGRVSAEQYVALFKVLVNAHNDEGLGFFSRPLRRGSFALLIHNTLGAATVAEAARRFYQGFNLLQDDMAFEAIEDGPLTGLRIVARTPAFAQHIFVHELLLRLFSRVVAWLHGGRLQAYGYDFAYPMPPQASEYAKLFAGRVRFDQAHSTIWLHSAKLQTPMRRDQAALREFVRRAPSILVMPRRHDEATSQRLRNHLQQARPHWPDLPAVAQAMHMSPSTLQRKLALEQSSFQMIKDQLRRDLAIVRLHTSATSIIGIAAELGFSDQAAFQRAFKTWTGSTPGAYRQRRTDLAADS